jgi:hypothetical protein
MYQSCQDTDVVVLFKGTYLLLLLITWQVTPKVFLFFWMSLFGLAH